MKGNGVLKDLPETLKSGWPWDTEVLLSVYDESIDYPKISIVTPSYNQGPFIEETIRSIILQNYPNLEYIIIDGGSNDETVEVIKKYDKWITYWVSEPDNGQSHAINKGIIKCTGTVFNWLNSDDYLTPNALEVVGANFFKSGCYALVGHVKDFPKPLVYRTRVRSLEETIAYGNLVQPGTFFGLEIIKKLGGVHEDCNYMMDAELWLKFLFTFGIEKVTKVADIFVNFRLHADSKTVSQNKKLLLEKLFLLNETAKKADLPEDTILELQKRTASDWSIKGTLDVENQIVLDKNKLTSFMFYIAATKLYILGDFLNAKKCIKHIEFASINNKQRAKLAKVYLGRVGAKLGKPKGE